MLELLIFITLLIWQKLTDDQLTNLDNLYTMISDASPDKIETTAEKLIALADGKSREAWPGVTFHQLKELMVSMIETKYFVTEPKTTPTIASAPSETSNTADTKPDETTNNVNAPVQNGTKVWPTILSSDT